MNKAELIYKISKDAGITKQEASDVIDSFTKSVMLALKTGDKVRLTGFGTFSVSEQNARIGRNPQTGVSIQIKARRVPKFKAGKKFTDDTGPTKK